MRCPGGFCTSGHVSLWDGELKIAHPHQVVSGGGEGEHPAHALQSTEACLALQSDGLDPSEDLLHPFPFSLADAITLVPGGPFVDGAAPVGIILCT